MFPLSGSRYECVREGTGYATWKITSCFALSMQKAASTNRKKRNGTWHSLSHCMLLGELCLQSDRLWRQALLSGHAKLHL